MSEPTESVMVRRLPDGPREPARIESRQDLRLRIGLTGQDAGRGWESGTLVEVQSPQSLYLGAVLGRQGSTLVIEIEHSIDRAALAAIEDVWRTPAE